MSKYGHLTVNMCLPQGEEQKEDKEAVIQSFRLSDLTEL
jgi:hypothetical protein